MKSNIKHSKFVIVFKFSSHKTEKSFDTIHLKGFFNNLITKFIYQKYQMKSPAIIKGKHAMSIP